MTDSAQGCNNLAWRLATSDQPHLRNPLLALELAKKAVALAPKEGSYWTTLGAAHYRAGNWKDAIDALHTSIELGHKDGLNWFFLAMAHGQLGQKDEARKWYDQAAQWLDPQYEAEAAELLGINKKVP